MESELKAYYTAHDNRFNVEIYSIDGCLEEQFFMNIVNNRYVRALVFLFLGLVFGIGGYKFYKVWISVFIPLIMVVLGFSLYLSFVEKNNQHTSKFLMLIGIFFALIIVAMLMVCFTNIIYYVLAFLVSYNLGLLTKSMLASKYEFFTQQYTEYIPIAVFLVLFIALFMKIKKTIILICTSILGTVFFSLSLHYLKIIQFDEIFENTKDIDNTNFGQFILLSICIFLICAGTQYMLFLRKSENKDKDLNIELNFKN